MEAGIARAIHRGDLDGSGDPMEQPLARSATVRDPGPAFERTIELQRLRDWLAVLDEMSAADAPRILDEIERQIASGRDFALFRKLFWERWAEIDGAAAAARLSEKGEGHTKDVDHFFKAWFVAEPAAAADAVAGMYESPMARMALEGLMHGWAETDLDGCVSFVAERLDAEGQHQAALHVTGSVIQKFGVDGAMKWYDQLPLGDNPHFETEVARVLTGGVGTRGGHAVIDFALARLEQPWLKNRREQEWVVEAASRGGASPWDFIASVAVQGHAGEPDAALAARVLQRGLQSPVDLARWLEANGSHPAAAAFENALLRAVERNGGN